MSGDIVKSRPHTPTLADAVLLDDERRRAVTQRHDLLAVEVRAAVGGVHLEARVERGDRDVALVGRGICEPHGFGPPPGCSVPTT